VFKLLGRDVLGHWQVARGGLQVLAQGEDVHPRIPQVQHRVDDLVVRLAQAQHDG
jgi:hypothetical protein